MPDAETARAATGYERGTITPFGSIRAWPVVADEPVAGRTISLGGGAHGVAFTVDRPGLTSIRALDAQARRRHRPAGLTGAVTPRASGRARRAPRRLVGAAS